MFKGAMSQQSFFRLIRSSKQSFNGKIPTTQQGWHSQIIREDLQKHLEININTKKYITFLTTACCHYQNNDEAIRLYSCN